MRGRLKRCLLGMVLAVLTLSAVSGAATPASLPPAELFFGDEELGRTALSPSGRWLLVAARAAGQRRGLVVYDLHGNDPPRAVAGFADIDIDEFHWVGEEYLIFDVLDGQRGSGDQRYGGGLFSVRRDGTELNQLILMQWVRNPGQGTQVGRRLDATHWLVHVPHDQTPGSESVIVDGARHPQDFSGDWALKRLDIRTGRVQSLNVAAPPGTRNWLFDSRGEPVFATASRDGQIIVYRRIVDPQGALTRDWQVLQQAELLRVDWSLFGLDHSGRLYVTQSAGSAGERVLKRFDFERGAPAQRPLVATPGFDFRGSLVFDEGGKTLLGVRADTDAESTVWLDPDLAALQKAIDQRLPDRVNRVVCRRCGAADRTAIVESWSDRHPGEIWVWRGPTDAPTTWRRVGIKRPGVDPARMAEVAFTRVAARDGRGLPLWLTLPAETAAPGPAPAVVLVHGGPWVRGGHWAWQPMQQFLASRGYVVIEPEFRGSSGYGFAHFRAGWKQWGRAMQDDLADALAWAVQRGLVDPARVCIAGGSYGGYAALMGLVRQPSLFRCAAAWVPVTEPRWLLREGSPDIRSSEASMYTMPQLLADLVDDRDWIGEISPFDQAARIRQPLLLAWSERDRRVPAEHGRRLHEVLRAAGHPHDAVEYEGEGHQRLKLQTRLDFARRLDALLGRELKAPAIPARGAASVP